MFRWLDFIGGGLIFAIPVVEILSEPFWEVFRIELALFEMWLQISKFNNDSTSWINAEHFQLANELASEKTSLDILFPRWLTTLRTLWLSSEPDLNTRAAIYMSTINEHRISEDGGTNRTVEMWWDLIRIYIVDSCFFVLRIFFLGALPLFHLNYF